MGTGTAPAKRKSNRQFQFLLFIWLAMFGLGVFAGVTLTKKAFGMPSWVQRILGIEPIIADIRSKATPAVNSVIPSVSENVKTLEKVPSDPPQQPTEVNSQAETQPKSANSQTSEGTTESDSPLDNKVREYNALLSRVQNAEKSYKVAKKAASDPKANLDNLEPAIAQQQSDLEEIKRSLAEAKEILEVVKRDPRFAATYQEDALALTLYPIPESLDEAELTELRFLKNRD